MTLSSRASYFCWNWYAYNFFTIWYCSHRSFWSLLQFLNSNAYITLICMEFQDLWTQSLEFRCDWHCLYVPFRYLPHKLPDGDYMHFANLVFKNLLDIVNSKFAYKETQFAKKKSIASANTYILIPTKWYITFFSGKSFIKFYYRYSY